MKAVDVAQAIHDGLKGQAMAYAVAIDMLAAENAAIRLKLADLERENARLRASVPKDHEPEAKQA